jgi:2-phospho-L-lactate guanylyltransferase
MSVWALLPVQPFEEGKTRLSTVLDNESRADLNRKFFRHVLGVTLEVFGPQRVLVISRSADILDAVHARTLKEPYNGDLNRALTDAARVAASHGAEAVLSLSSDLPLLQSDDIREMIDAGAGHDAVIAPDHAGLGTNALLLKPDFIPYAYGEGSFQKHKMALEARRARIALVRRDGLAWDIDTPPDLAHLRKLRADF